MSDMDNVFYSPSGNLEVWESKPNGYFTHDEWLAAHPELIPPPPTPLTFDEVKSYKLDEIANARYSDETGGITINGVSIRTDRESQAMITGAALQATIDSNFTCNWKQSNGTFTTINATQMLQIASAVRAHVQLCFDKEAAKVALVHAATTKEEILTITWND